MDNGELVGDVEKLFVTYFRSGSLLTVVHMKTSKSKVVLYLVCAQCQSDMIKGCGVKVEGVMYGIKIFNKKKGLFNTVSEKPKAAVCPNCGYVALYITNYKRFI